MYTPGSEHTQREIAQQPDLWRETAAQIAARREEIDAFCAPLLQNAGARIVLTGAGTSAYIGDIAAPALARMLGRPFEAVATTDIVSAPHGFLSGEGPLLLVSFARSGNSPESVAATAIANRLVGDVRHLIFTCNATGALAMQAIDSDRVLAITLPTRANDQGFAMTSSFSSMLLAVLLALGGDVDVEAIARAAEHLLATLPPLVQTLTEGGFERVIYLGSGPLLGLAHESSLKLMELTAGKVDAYYESALGFRHGPKALVRERALVVQFVSGDEYTRRFDLDLARELLSDGVGRLLVIAFQAPAEFASVEWGDIDLSGAHDGVLALGFVVFAQMLALAQSQQLGLTPDNPFPSGTVNRVVQGVRIHDLV